MTEAPSPATCSTCRAPLAPVAQFCPHCGRPRARTDGDALLGKVLGERFLVHALLGQGASGNIYRAEHVTLRRKVAVKVLHLELCRDDLAVERFRREATSVSELDNEHLVEIHDFGRTPDGRLYLAMELLEGETLDAVLGRAGRLPVEQVVDVVTQVAEALVGAHDVGFVHRDLRPRNVYLSARRGRANFVKLLDFGLSKLVEREGQAASTSLGMTFGDPRYMSPEQARGDAIDRRADVYQLGCIAYELLTGAPPFVGGKVFDVLSRHVTEAPAPIARARPDAPAWLQAAVLQMLAKRPEDRFAGMPQVIEALRLGAAAAAGSPGSASAVVATPAAGVDPGPAAAAGVEPGLGRTALGPHTPTAAEVRAHVAAQGPSGTPRVGSLRVDDLPAGLVPGSAPGGAEPRVPVGASTVPPALAGVVAGEVTTAAAPASAAPASATSAAPASAAAARAAATAAAPSPDAAAIPEDVSDAAGISAAWYADGEALAGGRALDRSQAHRLQDARRMMESAEDSLSDVYLPARRPYGRYAALAGGLVVLGVVAALLLRGGDAPGQERPASAPPDAGVAVVPGAAVPAPPVDAAPASPPPGPTAEPRQAAAAGRSAPAGGPRKAPRTEPAPPAEPPPAAEPEPPPAPVSSEEAREEAETHARAGESLLRGGDAGGAAAAFKKAVALDPSNLTALVGMAELASGQGSFAAAIGHLKKAARVAPRSSLVQTLLGEAYLAAGNAKGAEAAFKKALQLDPDNARARTGYNEASNLIPPPEDEP